MTTQDTRFQRLLLRMEIDDFNARYSAVLDRGDILQWPGFFAQKPVYQLISRESFDAGHPIGLMYCDSQGMLVDRVTSIKNSMVYSPRTVLHLVTNIELDEEAQNDEFKARANFLLVENMIDKDPRLLMAGTYFDTFQCEDGELKLRERRCVYDTLMIQTSVVFPV